MNVNRKRCWRDLANSKRYGNLFIVSGPSGAGKGTLVARLLQSVSDAWLSVSATTRKPRNGEIDGIHYFFLDESAFKHLISDDGFLEWALVHGNYYGTLRSAVEHHIKSGDQVILEIDVQGALQVREKMPDAHLIFIEPPSIGELERRLRGRGTETEDVIVKRMQTAHLELSQKMEYDIQLVNDDLDQAASELIAIVNSFAERKKE